MAMSIHYADDLPKDLRVRVEHLLAHSPLFTSLMRDISEEDYLQLLKPKGEAILPELNEVWFPHTTSDNIDVCMQHLRQLKQHAMRHIIWWELGLHGDMQDSYHSISDTAAALLSQAVVMAECLISPRFGKLGDFSFCVIGLGKLGGRELNLGSDIDLLFVWQGEGNTQGGRKSVPAKEYYAHFSRMLIRLIGEITTNGLVWPVDMRLRPGGDGAAIALNLDATLSHYLEYGQTWERAMLIKARAVAGDMALGQAFIDGVAPFVYRKYLDYSSVTALADMKRRIDAQAGSRTIQAGYDVKKGKGGIREIEFMIQSLQLMHGGRNQSLRAFEGQQALTALVQYGHLSADEAVNFFDAYIFLRKIEHAIQARNGEQTQRLPDDYIDYLQQVLDIVDIQQQMLANSQWVSSVFETRVLPLTVEDESKQYNWLHDEGLSVVDGVSDTDKTAIIHTLQHIDKQLRRGLLPERSYHQVEKILQVAMPLWLDKGKAVDAVQAFADLLHAISGRATWLDLLATHQGTRDWLIDILSASKYLSTQMIKNPAWLEWPLESERGELEIQRVCASINDLNGSDEEIFLRELGRLVDQARLQCALYIHADQENPLIIGAWLADVADAVTQACLRSSLQQLKLPETFALVALAMGKHGSREMGLVSDLDMVFVLAEEPNQVINGRSTREWAQRLGRRMIRQITAMPPFGAGYEFDARLRPSGNSGVLVTTLEGFKDYQLSEAQTWEHQVLCRARAVTGSKMARQQVMDVVFEVISLPRAFKSLATDVWQMRQKMLEHLSSKKNNIINLKQDKGGLVDIEFLAQFARLIFGGKHQGTVVILENIPSHAPKIWQEHGLTLAGIYLQYRQLENIVRVELWASIGQLPADAGHETWRCLQQRAAIDSPKILQNTMQDVHGIFLQLLEMSEG
ncbi:MAG: bifunctional [glutamate--ammonia ligase]-adenylyl-L-tyrosine phosphorylase/[glutamate--ammonia-ligase] adenylyltransferase [Ghiorsea sp.]|nr:bifunctional [glutamate--ammonia ligase]-adenylyl-L-tyrosine phosphorylase/[glutamate--ammonia-ligase] adenylyltransferase [Ghiorsea sp.]